MAQRFTADNITPFAAEWDEKSHFPRDVIQKTGELGFADWSFDVVKKAGYLLSHGASFLITAEDSFNMRPDGHRPRRRLPK